VNLVLHIWRQKSAREAGIFARHEVRDITPEMSFLEMLDVLNERLAFEAARLLRSRATAGRGSAARAA